MTPNPTEVLVVNVATKATGAGGGGNNVANYTANGNTEGAEPTAVNIDL